MKVGSVLSTLLVGLLLVGPLADAWMETQASSHFHQSGESMALVSPSIFKEGLGRRIRGLLPPPWGVLQVCQTPLQLTGCLAGFMGSGECDSTQHVWRCLQFSQMCSCCIRWHSWARFHLVSLGTDSNDCTIARLQLAISLGPSIPSWIRWDWYKGCENVTALKVGSRITFWAGNKQTWSRNLF